MWFSILVVLILLDFGGFDFSDVTGLVVAGFCWSFVGFMLAVVGGG